MNKQAQKLGKDASENLNILNKKKSWKIEIKDFQKLYNQKF